MRWAVAVWLAAAAPARAVETAQPGDFLRLGPGPRGAALGGAWGALADDASAVAWNPAALHRLVKPEVTASHVVLFEDAARDFAAFAAPHRRYGVFAAGYLQQSAGGFERRSGPSASPESFSTLEGAAFAGWGRRYAFAGREVALGLAAKSVRHQVDAATASGFGLDAGLLVDLPRAFAVGLRLQNVIAPSLTLVSEAQDFPRGFDVWPAWSAVLGRGYALAVAARWSRYGEGAASIGAGAELVWHGFAALRAGYSSEGFSSGFGANFGNYSLDYSALAHELGLSHNAALTVRFGQTRQELEAAIRKGLERGAADEAGRLALAYLRQAEQQLADGDLAKALQTADVAPLWAPNDGEVAKRAQAVKDKIAARLEERSLEQAFLAGLQAYQAGDLLRAQGFFLSVLETRGGHAQAREHLAKIRAALSRREAEGAKRARDDLAERVKALLDDAEAAFGEGRYKSAAALAQRALGVRPDSAKARSMVSKIETQADAIFADARRDHAAGRSAKAAKALREAVEQFPEQKRFGDLLAKVLKDSQRELGDAEKAKVERLYYDAVQSYLAGDRAKAAALLGEVRAIDAGHEGARKLAEKIAALGGGK